MALVFIEDMGPVTINALLSGFGSPRAVFSASSAERAMVSRISATASSGIEKFTDWKRVDSELEKASKMNVSLVTPIDEAYPDLLRHIYDYPPLLYLKGEPVHAELPLAIVGSRRSTAQGVYICDRISRELALKGVTIVSGMARGIDSAAHRGALSVRGKTTAILGSGLDVIYPPENRKLYEAICDNGTVISEYPFGTRPMAHNFPRRNRIISGMSHGVVVVEAAEKSGSLITARMALEQGREVFAVPGSIESGTSRGTNSLIKEGAKLVQNVEDILNEIIPQLDCPGKIQPAVKPSGTENNGRPSTDSLCEEHLNILRLIGDTPVHLDSLTDRSNLSVNRLLDILLILEMRGHVRQLPGRYFTNTKKE
ncbi:MAG: DNA-processing protein DprA [Syntrophales bacterium]|nr:DNA-processing protein DprA [Syntrophales bacterium]